MGKKVIAWNGFLSKAKQAGFKVEALAELLGVSAVYLRREIKKQFSVTAKEYLRALQVNTSLCSLESGGSIKTAAWDGRFKTTQHLSREVKAMIGATPKEYLKRKMG